MKAIICITNCNKWNMWNMKDNWIEWSKNEEIQNWIVIIKLMLNWYDQRVFRKVFYSFSVNNFIFFVAFLCTLKHSPPQQETVENIKSVFGTNSIPNILLGIPSKLFYGFYEVHLYSSKEFIGHFYWNALVITIDNLFNI